MPLNSNKNAQLHPGLKLFVSSLLNWNAGLKKKMFSFANEPSMLHIKLLSSISWVRGYLALKFGLFMGIGSWKFISTEEQDGNYLDAGGVRNP